MRFGKLFRYDMRGGFSSCVFRIAAIVFLVLISCTDMYIRKHTVYRLADSVPAATCMDYLCYLLGGIREYVPGGEENFIFPAKWFLFHLLILYGCLHYSVRDLSSLGITVLSRSGKRVLWWLSKCLWNCCYVIAAYGAAVCAVFLFCAATGEKINLDLTPEFLNTLMEAGSFYETVRPAFILTALGLPVLMSAGNSLIQLTLTLFIKPMFSFAVVAALLLCGAYKNLPVFWETFAMPLRSVSIVENGYDPVTGLVIGTGVAAAAAAAGTICFKRRDILRTDGA